mgnify:CR=1 FL=1
MIRAIAHLVAWLVAAWHARIVVPSVRLWEAIAEQAEASVTAVIREWFGLAYKLINGAGAWVLSLFDASWAQQQRLRVAHQEAWANWWREDRTSTLNAVVANAHARGGCGAGTSWHMRHAGSHPRHHDERREHAGFASKQEHSRGCWQVHMGDGIRAALRHATRSCAGGAL